MPKANPNSDLGPVCEPVRETLHALAAQPAHLRTERALNAETKQVGDASNGGDLGRERIREALVALIGERGYSATTLEAVLECAAVDRATFEAHFSSLDDCFAQIWQDSTQQFVDRALAAYAAADGWREGMRAQAWEYCRFLQEDHSRARICMVEVAFGGELVQARRDVFMDAYVELVHLGRFEREEVADMPRARAEAIVGAIWERVAGTVKAGAVEQLPAQVPKMMFLAVMPYFGAEAAEEELRRGPEDIARYERGEL